MTYFPCCLTVVWACVTLIAQGLLQWDCSAQTPNTTFTVQRRTQGDHQWKEVAQCVRLTSRSCDISKAFADFDLYNWIRLGQEESLGFVWWSSPSMFDPLKETVYSPPTLSLSLQGPNLTVNATFPCSPIRACAPKDCCPVSVLFRCCITLTLYSEHHPSKWQTHEQCGMAETVSHEFRGLALGHRYCAMANFTSSPASSPRCVSLPSRAAVQKPLWMTGAVCFMLLVIVPVLCFLRQRWVTAETHLPRALPHPHPASSSSRGLSQLPKRETGVPQQPHPCGLRVRSDGLGQWGTEGGMGPSDVSLLLPCVVVPSPSQAVGDSLPQTRRGSIGTESAPPKFPPPLDMVQGCRVVPDIPLYSVKLGACEGEELEGLGWFELEQPVSERPCPGGTEI
ncbi:hypothetical protein AAFF_G00109010 [Aldrovandia affinis]|uniref:Fibronectin type-III domain-containing protein n=1 Tax=Aldrovandia affinis TaxID=143900 RepID=A0AAD7RU11_9TELE|nr:hypothetical protein AAFF_G00109010 [Aldrovandia affinis]